MISTSYGTCFRFARYTINVNYESRFLLYGV
jgi:hypothetical protein